MKNPRDYQRIMVIGNNGSGKSYLAKRLADLTGLPAVHLDVHFWKPGWVMPSREEWIQTQTELAAQDRWIIDGNHCNTMDVRFQRADAVIFLDVSRVICQLRLLKRNGTKRTDSPQYLKEKLDREFIQFCRRMWAFPKTGKKIIMKLHENYPDTPFFVIKGGRALKKVLKQWETNTTNAI